MATTENKEERVEISEEIDTAQVTYEALRLAEIAGFTRTEQYMVATATSEVARNIVFYAKRGKVTIRILKRETREGIEIVAEDNGPGIADIGAAMKDHFSTSQGLGLGLPGAKRMMDEFHIDIEREVGTRITMRKWV